MKLMVYSKSTEKFIDNYPYDEGVLVAKPPDKSVLNQENTVDEAWAIGGGSVIDTAKILCRNSIWAIPTTYSGASGTSHAVYWHRGKKYNVKTALPMTRLERDYLKSLPPEVEAASKVDCLCHIIESLISGNEMATKLALEAIDVIKGGDWLHASILAGNAIEFGGTNLIHGLSYPLTGKYKLPHGVALSHILNLAKTYKKIEAFL